MKRYLFLAAWVEGSDSSSSMNGIHDQPDLMPRFVAGEEDMIKLIIEGAPNEKVALAFSYRECWHDNMTAHDSVSDIIELDVDISTAMYVGNGCKLITVDVAPHEPLELTHS